MSMNRAVDLLDTLLRKEVESGRPPRNVPDSVFDGPKTIEDLLGVLEEEALEDEDAQKINGLIDSVLGGYLGRGELIQPHLQSGELGMEFVKELQEELLKLKR